MNIYISKVMDSITRYIKNTIGDNLTGIYLHGSAAFGCFNPQVSDIDFIAVIKEPLDIFQKKDIISFLLSMTSTQKGLEASFVLEKDCVDFKYPTPYQLHFSEYHRKFYEEDMEGHLNRLQGTDKDLAAHFTVINNVGITWYGKNKELVFSPVPPEYYLDSIKFDIESASKDIHENPVYMILNLCRVYAYIQEGSVFSKADGGKWGAENIEVFKNTIQKAYNKYVYNKETAFAQNELTYFAEYMLERILG